MAIKVLFDINILLDVFLVREPFYMDSSAVLNYCEKGKLEGWISADTFSTVHYFLKKGMGEAKSGDTILEIIRSLSVVPVREKTVVTACEMSLPDFEDNLKVACAKELRIDYIMTRDADYTGSQIPAMTPSAFLKEWKSGNLGAKDVQTPFVDLKAQFHQIYNDIDNHISDVIHNTAFIRGRYVQEFEKNFAKFCEAKHCLGVGNGTDAVFIALKALEIGSGDEVIVPANTFIATSEAVSMTGAKVVFADCDPDTYNIDVNLIESKITSRTKAIIPVHLYGQPANMPVICEIAKQYGLKIVQDCAQAHGATFDDKPFAYFGDVLCFSFYPGKNLGAYGDAGAVVTNDDNIAEKALMIANHGRIGKYNHEFEGVNSRMDGIQGAVLNVKLKYLEQWNENRRRNADLYSHFLKDIENISLPCILPNVKHVYHLYVIRSKQRDALQNFLKENGISSGIHYPIALPNLKAYQYLGHKLDDFPVASQYQQEILSLPMYPELSEDMIEYVVQKIRNFL